MCGGARILADKRKLAVLRIISTRSASCENFAVGEFTRGLFQHMLVAENSRLVLGLKVRSLRQQRGDTLHIVADRSVLSVSCLSEIEKGKK